MSTPRRFICRHAETEWNVTERLQGIQDSPLTPRGQAQARSLAETARALGIRHVITSPLGRAHATAAVVAARCEATLVLEPALTEIACGDASGMTVKAAIERWPEWWARRTGDPWNTPWPGGESYAEASARVSAWLAAVASPWPVLPTLIVSHGSVLRSLLVAGASWSPDRALTMIFESAALHELAGDRLLTLPMV